VFLFSMIDKKVVMVVSTVAAQNDRGHTILS